MGKYCPKTDSKVVYLQCQECENKICKENNVFYLLVAGTRTYTDYKEFKQICDHMLSQIKIPICIVTGGAAGADALAERYGKEKGYMIQIFPAEWDKYGKSAGPIRNNKMHAFISMYTYRAALCFWDGASIGTKGNFELARQYGTRIAVWNYTKKIWLHL